MIIRIIKKKKWASIRSPQTEKEIRAYWKQAINDAKLIAKSSGKNVYPKSFDKTLERLQNQR